MPVRKIPKSFRSVTGRFPSVINYQSVVGYESKLEHDYHLKLEFDSNVKSYEVQPVKIPGVVNGRPVSYVPDCLVTYKNGRRSLLVELKYTSELDENDENLMLKIARMKEFAAEINIDFSVITEKDVHDDFFTNCLRLYRRARPPVGIKSIRPQILKILKHSGEITLKNLLLSFGNTPTIWADYTPSIWHMLFKGEIATDLKAKISYASILRKSHG
jgi:hypothetical protein